MTDEIEKTEEERELEIRARHIEYVNTRLTPLTREKFLQKLKETANVSLSADLVGISRVRAYQVRKKDKAFAEAWDEAIEIGVDNLEYEARRRAMDGTKRPVFYKGKVCGHIQEYSDKLMETLLAAHRPSKYNRSMVVPQGAKIVINIRTPDGTTKPLKPTDVTPKQIEEEEVAITD